MKIGWDFLHVSPERTGTFFHLVRWLQAVAAHPGEHAHKLYANEGFLAAAGGAPAGFAVESMGPEWGRSLQLARERFFRKHGARIRGECDLLVTLWYPAFFSRSPALAILLDAMPFLHPGMMGGWKDRVRNVIRVRGARRAAAWLCTTETTARALSEECGFDRTKVFVAGIPLPAPRNDAAGAFPPALPEGVRRPFAFYCADRSPRKNHARLVRAWRQAFPANEMQLVLAGRSVGKYLRETKAAIAGGVRAGAVCDTGEVDGAMRDALYRECDFAVYPSLCEGFGMPVLEAVAAGKSVLVHRGTACEEVGGEAVLACDCTDEDALASGLKTLATDAFLQKRLAQARPGVLARFSGEVVAGQILRAAEAAKELG